MRIELEPIFSPHGDGPLGMISDSARRFGMIRCFEGSTGGRNECDLGSKNDSLVKEKATQSSSQQHQHHQHQHQQHHHTHVSLFINPPIPCQSGSGEGMLRETMYFSCNEKQFRDPLQHTTPHQRAYACNETTGAGGLARCALAHSRTDAPQSSQSPLKIT